MGKTGKDDASPDIVEWVLSIPVLSDLGGATASATPPVGLFIELSVLIVFELSGVVLTSGAMILSLELFFIFCAAFPVKAAGMLDSDEDFI